MTSISHKNVTKRLTGDAGDGGFTLSENERKFS